jgi:hypothetical protein
MNIPTHTEVIEAIGVPVLARELHTNYERVRKWKRVDIIPICYIYDVSLIAKRYGVAATLEDLTIHAATRRPAG